MPWLIPSTRATNYKVLAADWNAIANDLAFIAEVGYAEFTSPVTVTATTVGTAVQLVTMPAVTYEAAPILIEYYLPRVTPGVAQLNLDLRDGTTVLGQLGSAPANGSPGPIYGVRRLTPTAASHTYNLTAWNNAAATATISVGTGGTAGDQTAILPGFIRVTHVPT